MISPNVSSIEIQRAKDRVGTYAAAAGLPESFVTIDITVPEPQIKTDFELADDRLRFSKER